MDKFGIGCLVATGLFALYDYLRQKESNLKKDKSQKNKQKLIKICLTGGPCGGKSQGINCIYSAFKQIQAPFFVVPEAATIIGTSGLSLDLSKLPGRSIQLFQIYLMRLQYNLEDAVVGIAQIIASTAKTPVILCDRGLLDGKAYAGPENFAKMLNQINFTEEQINQRYHAVVHMVTAAKGASQHYVGNNVRRQDVDFAIQLDVKLQKCYANHPKRYVISNDFFVKNFQDKKVILLAQIHQILQIIIQQNNLEQYYKVYNNMRKQSDDKEEPSEYIIRKRKLQKYKNASISPARAFESQ